MLTKSGAVGTEALMGVLKNYCRSLNLKTAITVGVIGYPNVGKSSLINSLKRRERGRIRLKNNVNFPTNRHMYTRRPAEQIAIY